MGLLDNFNLEDPRTMGLLNAGLNMLGNSGASRTPINLGQILGGGLQSYTGTLDDFRKRKQQEEELARVAKMQDLQRQQSEMQLGQMQRKNEMDAAIRGAYKEAYDPGGQERNPEWNAVDQQAIEQPQFLNRPASLNMQNLSKKLMSIGAFDESMAIQKQLRGENYKLGKDERLFSPDNKIIAEGLSSAPKRELREGYIVQDENGNWAIDPVLQAAHLASRRAGSTSVNVGKDNLGLKPRDRFDMESKLSDDYRAETKTDQGVLSAASKIKTSLSKPGALADQATIYSFAKMLDPDGAVREADYAAIMNTAGLYDRMQNYVQKLKTGEALSENQRKEMLDVMGRFESVANNRIGTVRSNYSPRAEAYNLDPKKLFMDASKAPTATPLKKSAMKGQIESGYRFKGGDPSKQENWEQL